MVWTLRLAGEWLHLLRDGVEERRRPLAKQEATGAAGQPAKQQGDLAAFWDWAKRYEQAVDADRYDKLLALGREIPVWLGAPYWIHGSVRIRLLTISGHLTLPHLLVGGLR